MPRTKVNKGRRSPMVTHKSEVERALRARMKWLLDFLNQDMKSLNPLRCLKLFYDFWDFAIGDPLFGFIEKGYRVETKGDLPEIRTFLHICQEELRIQLRQTLGALKKSIRKKKFKAGSTSTFGEYAITYLVGVDANTDRVYKSPIFFPVVPLPRTSDKMKGEIANIRKGLLFDALIRVISPFPLSRIKTCQKPDCGNYFFQKTTKSKGDFCSPRCQNWARTNRWRKANPDKYNAYHRNRRAKAKEDQVEVKCSSCGFQQSLGSIKDLMEGIFSDIKECPTCGEMLLHFIRIWENGKWVEGEPLGSFEWEEFLRNETQKGED